MLLEMNSNRFKKKIPSFQWLHNPFFFSVPFFLFEVLRGIVELLSPDLIEESDAPVE